ncbi:MAG TPA: hypothetical protein V6D05_18205 [Stenomitos sp.]
MKTLPLVAVLAVFVSATGCTNRIVAVQDVKVRTYSKNVQPVTRMSQCQECHLKEKGVTYPDLGTWAYDSTKKVTLKTMVNDNAKDLLTPQQAKDVLDWLAAGAPNDPVTY